MLIEYIPEVELPSSAGNRLYLDYLEGPARHLFTHGPLDFEAALEERRRPAYPRQALSDLLVRYNSALGAGPETLAAARDLADEGTFCVIGGQQVGLLGGPVFTTYKIAAIIRLARDLERRLGTRVVPVFWLASEDHDLYEVNHAFYQKPDGEIGRVHFSWDGRGRPLADLPLTPDVQSAAGRYLELLPPGPHTAAVAALCRAEPGDDYCTWHGRIFTRLFAGQGLVMVQPEVLRPLAGPFFRRALEGSDDVRRVLARAADLVRQAAYAPQLTTAEAGGLFTFDARGHRRRVEEPASHVRRAGESPELYSADAALRPVLADSIFPVLADVLGPGEIAYQAMLRPLHELLGVPQPVIFPRPHYTVLGAAEAASLRRYGVRARDMLTGEFDMGRAMRRLVARLDLVEFGRARANLAASLEPLRDRVEAVDPSLVRTWEGTVKRTWLALDKLEDRTARARLSQAGLQRQELHALHNLVMPRGRLQERTFPVTHFVNQYGPGFVRRILEAGDPYRFEHALLTMEDTDAGS